MKRILSASLITSFSAAAFYRPLLNSRDNSDGDEKKTRKRGFMISQIDMNDDASRPPPFLVSAARTISIGREDISFSFTSVI